MSNAKGVGRPSTTDPDVIIERLINRYPNGSPFSSADELFAANPDLASKKKTLANNAKSYWGMPLNAYLKEVGLVQKKGVDDTDILNALHKRYPKGAEFTTVNDLADANPTLRNQIKSIAKATLIAEGFIVEAKKTVSRYVMKTFPSGALISFDNKPDYTEVGSYIRVDAVDGSGFCIGRVVEVQDSVLGTSPEAKCKKITPKQFVNALIEIAPFEAGTILNELFHIFTLSEDGTKLLEYLKDNNPEQHIVAVPDGVVYISEEAFFKSSFWDLYLPASIRQVGKSIKIREVQTYTSYDIFTESNRTYTYEDERKSLRKVFVAPGNQCFYSNDTGFYSWLPDGSSCCEYLFPVIESKQENAEAETPKVPPLQGYSFCISGSFQNYKNTNDLENAIRECGAKIDLKLNPWTDFLVINDVSTDKTAVANAKLYGVKVISEDILISLMD